MSRNSKVGEQLGIYRVSSQKKITVEQLEKGMESLRKKMFLYETL